MKILLADSYAVSTADVRLVADSAWRPDRRPFFVPEGAGEVLLQVRPALRVSRLGKNIAERFASRYYDAVALCALCDDGAPFLLRDDSVVLGPWRPLEALVSMVPGIAGADALIARLSAGVTLKTGDVIILPDILGCHRLSAPDTLRVRTDDTNFLDFNIR